MWLLGRRRHACGRDRDEADRDQNLAVRRAMKFNPPDPTNG